MHNCFQVYGLTCGHAANPLAIEPEAVSFGWKARHTLPGRLQKSYRIQVFHNSGKNSPVWDSGVVLSRASYGLPYQGPELLEGGDYQWTVTVEDDQGALAQSQPAFFSIGITRREGSWLAGANYMAGDTAPLFRKEFSAPGDLVSAKLYLAAVGYAEVTLNGRRVSGRVLEPGWTDFRKTVLYSAYDIFELLRAGENAVGVMMGSGWYSNGNLCYDTASMGGQFLLQLVMVRTNGERITRTKAGLPPARDRSAGKACITGKPMTPAWKHQAGTSLAIFRRKRTAGRNPYGRSRRRAGCVPR